ncbi:MAG: exo-alpha-sialidase [Ktedonobacteraceae bacterium]|nr:exo-alpha-sialidase [Ktedonobacteraceae bacterium]
MRNRKLSIIVPVALVGVLLLSAIFIGQLGVRGPAAQAHSALANFTKLQQRLISGFASTELNGQNVQNAASKKSSYFPTSDDGCPVNRGSNVKVNQNCLNISDGDLQGRGQANNETTIAQDPNNPKHIISAYNDYRRGDGNCYGAYSLDGGKNWADTTLPMSFTRGTAFGGGARQYWQAGGDAAVAWDTKGNAYFQCQVFNRGARTSANPDQSSAIYVFRSTGNAGASWNFPGRPVIEYNDVVGVGKVLEDKPYMTVDNHVGSKFQDRIYVTYTEFAADGTAYIYESYSNDYGEHFSPRVVVSSSNPLCANTFGLPTPNGPCNENQFSQPFTGPDGALYVAYANFNNAVTGLDNRNQMLLSKSTDGGATFSPPVKVSDYYDLPDCLTYQGADPGRACVPEKGPSKNSIFRASNYPSGAVNPKHPSQVVVTFGSYINAHDAAACTPAGFSAISGINLYNGVKVSCNNAILVSVSNDSGATFTGTTTDPRELTTVSQQHKQANSDQFFQWAAYTNGGKLAVSYFDRQYGADETTGFSDISLSGSTNLSSFATVRVTTGSMPPPTEFAGVFYGDYSGLSAVTNDAHPLWMDTRSPDLILCPNTGTTTTPPAVCKFGATNASLANDQDAYTATVEVP